MLLLQYRLWVAKEGSLAEVHRLQAEVEEQETLNRGLRERNRQLELEVLELQHGLETVEDRARRDLGMIREGETYYQVVEESAEESAEEEPDGEQP